MVTPSPMTAPAQDCAGPHVPRRIALATIAGFWTLYFVINTLRAALEAEHGQVGWAVRRAGVTLAGMALTGLFCLLLRRIDDKSIATLVTTAFLVSIPVSAAYATFNFTAFYVIQPLATEMHHDSVKRGPAWQIADTGASWYFFIASWAVLYVALSYAYRVRHAERTAALYRAEAQSAQLRALRYQINPHFLFNTLNSLSTLVLGRRNDEAERMILNLARFFRTSLTADPTADVPLAEEIRMQRLYLDIEQVRFPDRLMVVVDIPAALDDVPVPAMLLQPIVENAIKYAVARCARPVTLTLRARAVAGLLRLTVEDDGDAVAGTPDGHGVGLRNVCDRLRARFEDRAECRFGPLPRGGFRVALAMPLPGQDSARP